MTSPIEARLLDLYTASCAPLSSNTMIGELKDFSDSDFTLAATLEEIHFVNKLSSIGLSVTAEAFEALSEEQPSEAIASLLTAAAFAKRLSTLASSLHQMCTTTADHLSGDPVAVMKQLELKVKAGTRPTGDHASALNYCFDFTPNTKWSSVEIPLKNRVGFRETADIISEGKVGEEALKVSEVGRRKQRNPTGFHRFTFKELGIEDSDSEGRRSRASSARGESTDGSTRGSMSIAAGATTSRSASSGGEECEDKGEHNPFLTGERSSSSVVFNNRQPEMIQDGVADPEWEEQQRHQRRFSRIRNRVPTGHPALMRGPSDELAGIVNEYERSLSGLTLDTRTAENTEANKSVQPAAASSSAAPSSSGNKRSVTLHESV